MACVIIANRMMQDAMSSTRAKAINYLPMSMPLKTYDAAGIAAYFESANYVSRIFHKSSQRAIIDRLRHASAYAMTCAVDIEMNLVAEAGIVCTGHYPSFRLRQALSVMRP